MRSTAFEASPSFFRKGAIDDSEMFHGLPSTRYYYSVQKTEAIIVGQACWPSSMGEGDRPRREFVG